MTVTGDEYVRLSQLKMLGDNLASDILGQFSDELDTIIGGDTTPVTDITARLASVNGGGSPDVDTQLDTLDGTKSAIKDAIIAKGVEVPEGTVFRDYATKIGEIETGSQVQTATVALNDGPNGHHARSISYVNEAGELVTDTQNSVVHLPVPQIIHVDFSGELMASHDYSGEITVVNTWSSSQTVYYVYGDATLTASS